MGRQEAYLFSIVIGYLCGCFLTAEIVAYIFAGKHAADIGSGNPGMANIMGHLGKKAGLLVLFGDTVKTVVAFIIAQTAVGSVIGKECVLWSGIGVILGHNFPFWKKFHGGKGVTVTCVWLMVFMPVWGTLSCVIGGIITFFSGYLPLGAVVIPLAAIPFTFYFEGTRAGIFVLAAFLIMISRHYRGLIRIVKGTETKNFVKNIRINIIETELKQKIKDGTLSYVYNQKTDAKKHPS